MSRPAARSCSWLLTEGLSGPSKPSQRSQPSTCFSHAHRLSHHLAHGGRRQCGLHSVLSSASKPGMTPPLPVTREEGAHGDAIQILPLTRDCELELWLRVDIEPSAAATASAATAAAAAPSAASDAAAVSLVEDVCGGSA